MKPILQHLVEMTGHRDHLRLEVSVLSTLQKLSGIKEVRAVTIPRQSRGHSGCEPLKAAVRGR